MNQLRKKFAAYNRKVRAIEALGYVCSGGIVWQQKEDAPWECRKVCTVEEFDFKG